MGLFGSDEFRQLVGDFLIECSQNVLLSISSLKGIVKGYTVMVCSCCFHRDWKVD